MNVFLLIRRHKTNIFLALHQNDTILELKKIIGGILKIQPKDQQLFTTANQLLEDEKELCFYGSELTNTMPYSPIELLLTCRLESGEFEAVNLEPYTLPISFIKA